MAMVPLKFLIIGGAGYIGSHVVQCLLNRGDEVVVFDNLSKGHHKAVLGGDFIEVARRPGDHPARLIASSSKIKAELGWKPDFENPERIITAAWNWHRKHPKGYGLNEKGGVKSNKSHLVE